MQRVRCVTRGEIGEGFVVVDVDFGQGQGMPHVVPRSRHLDDSRASIARIRRDQDVLVALHAAEHAGEVLAADHQISREFPDAHAGFSLLARQGAEHSPSLGAETFRFDRTATRFVQHIGALIQPEE